MLSRVSGLQRPEGVPYKLITHNVGNVDSIGNVIFLAAEERYACSTSTFMFHGVRK